MKAITDKHEIEKVQAELLPRLINDWALITVGTPEDWNTMTIAWGSMSDMWWQPVVNCWVTPARYTYEFLERHGSFTVSFFPAEYHDDLMTLGTKSGRDGDEADAEDAGGCRDLRGGRHDAGVREDLRPAARPGRHPGRVHGAVLPWHAAPCAFHGKDRAGAEIAATRRRRIGPAAPRRRRT